MMKLYLGTNVEFRQLNPEMSRDGLDFGKGAYLTPDMDQAWGMAKRKQMVMGGRRLVMEFDFDDSCLNSNSTDCLCFDSYSAEWTGFVLRNRNKAWRYVHQYSVVYGPVADGIMPTVIDEYLSMYPDENIALKPQHLSLLTNKLMFKKSQSRQACFCSIDAIAKYLKFIRLYEQK